VDSYQQQAPEHAAAAACEGDITAPTGFKAQETMELMAESGETAPLKSDSHMQGRCDEYRDRKTIFKPKNRKILLSHITQAPPE
jgi:hypothetical protein